MLCIGQEVSRPLERLVIILAPNIPFPEKIIEDVFKPQDFVSDLPPFFFNGHEGLHSRFGDKPSLINVFSRSSWIQKNKHVMSSS